MREYTAREVVERTTRPIVPRYLVFAFPDYDPLGGWNDYVGTSPSLKGAREIAQNCVHKNSDIDKVQIVDVVECKVVSWYIYHSSEDKFYWEDNV